MNALRNNCPLIFTVAAALTVTGWAYWTTLLSIGERWATDPQYTHGFLVPLFAAFLLWQRRGHVLAVDFRSRWWGVGMVGVGLCLWYASHTLYQPWLDAGSILVVLAGIAATAGGRRALVWAAPAVMFLAFMIPLPYRAQMMLGGTLQTVATFMSTYVLQTVGVPAVAEGNIILLTDTRLGVVEACNGLSMLVTFFALATGVAILAKVSVAERLLIIASAVPIAVASNVARISLTGVLFEADRGELARRVFHDFAGALMMPLALGMLLGELFFLKRAVLPAPARVVA